MCRLALAVGGVISDAELQMLRTDMVSAVLIGLVLFHGVGALWRFLRNRFFGD